MLIRGAPTQHIQPILVISLNIFNFNKVNPDDVVETVTAWHRGRALCSRALVRDAVITGKLLFDPLDNFRTSVAKLQQSSEISIFRVSGIIVCEFDVFELLGRRHPVRLDIRRIFLVVDRSGIEVWHLILTGEDLVSSLSFGYRIQSGREFRGNQGFRERQPFLQGGINSFRNRADKRHIGVRIALAMFDRPTG